MKKAAVIRHFGSQVSVARALGLTRSAVSQWKDLIPLEQAIKLNSLTKGELPLQMSDYGLPALQSRVRVSQRATA